MGIFFNTEIEFDKQVVEELIEDAIANGNTGYVCAVESNNLTYANTHPEFLEVVNSSLVNTCDGSVLAAMLSRIYRTSLSSYVGADLFMNFLNKRKYQHFFLGNTEPVLLGLKRNVSHIDPQLVEVPFVTLPFKSVHEFDYPSIAAQINSYNPDIIWVSLGAPKQEYFMNQLKPFLKRGVMFGVGAVFNFYSGVGPVKRAPLFMRKLKLEWLYRAFEEPHKNIPRYWRFIKILPGLLVAESRKARALRAQMSGEFVQDA